MTGHRIGRLAMALGLAALLAGCQEGGPLSGLNRKPSGDAAPARLGTEPTMTASEVEAPDVFSVSEPALWDGRPSLGGVWIAHPDATDPERVLIRNTENGRSVVGALFRREREMPGPRLQVSSDAAAALDLLAGKPTELSVVALRKTKVPEEKPAAPPAPVAAPAPEAAAEPKAAAEPEPLAAAAAAITAAEARNATAASSQPAAAPAPVAVRTPKMAVTDVVPPPPGNVTIPGEAAATAAPAAAPAAPLRSPLDKPFVQIGIYTVKDGAETVAERLRAAGVAPTVLDQQRDGKRFWRVVVGPAMTDRDRSALLEKVKGLGYTDAYYVTN